MNMGEVTEPMKTEKMSRVLSGLMLGLFMLSITTAMLLGAFKSRSYTVAFAAALVLVGAAILLARKLPRELHLLERLGAVKTGLILTGLCFVLNYLFSLWLRVEPSVDYYTFWLAACQLAEGVEFSYGNYLSLFPHILGYSTFLSWFLRIFGQHVNVAVMLNVILSTMSGVVIYLLCLRWRGLKTAAIAFFLWAICPSKMIYNTLVLPEPLYTFLILLSILIITELDFRAGDGKARFWLWCIAGFAAALVLRAVNAARPIAAVPIIAFFIWLLLLRGEKLKDKMQWKRWIAFALVMIAAYVPLGSAWDNHLSGKLGAEPAAFPGYSIYVGFNTQSMGSYLDEDMQLLLELSLQPGATPSSAQAEMFELAKARIGSGEIDFVQLFSAKLRTLLGNDEGAAYYASRAYYPEWVTDSSAGLSPAMYAACAVISNVFYYAVIMLALLGTVNIWKERRKSTVHMLPLFVLGLTLAHMLVEVSGRYHYSMIPMLVMLAAFSCRIDKETKLEG